MINMTLFMWSLAICMALTMGAILISQAIFNWFYPAQLSNQCPICDGTGKAENTHWVLAWLLGPEEKAQACQPCNGTGTWVEFERVSRHHE